MPHPEQILSSDLIVGSWFSRYHVDIVDCVMLEYFANSYSDHFRLNEVGDSVKDIYNLNHPIFSAILRIL